MSRYSFLDSRRYRSGDGFQISLGGINGEGRSSGVAFDSGKHDGAGFGDGRINLSVLGSIGEINSNFKRGDALSSGSGDGSGIMRGCGMNPKIDVRGKPYHSIGEQPWPLREVK